MKNHIFLILIMTSTCAYSNPGRLTVTQDNKKIMYAYVAFLLVASTFCPSQHPQYLPKQSSALPPLINATNTTMST
ncbi:hypothetical protein KBD08_00250 [Candidatus Babeliales bacterium]|nr:hypothetical protein [Candidatus Babeliales bacterium]